MSVTRRRFLHAATAGLAVAGRGPRTFGANRIQAQRRKLADRRRRIIFNDDGDDVWHPDAGTPEGFVSVRLQSMLGTQVDTLFYCTTQSFNSFTHRTKIGEVFTSREGAFANNNMAALMKAGTDPLALAVEYAHKHGIEAIWTLRMNDIHDAFTPPLYPQWKRDHPDALLGVPEDWSKHPPGSQGRWWAGVNFKRPDVRMRTLELIREVAENYDVDGIDLDWLRHPIHFPETLAGKPATSGQVKLITGLVADVRDMLDEIGGRRGRAILLSARVPVTIEHGLYMGTDVERWLVDGLIDILTVGGGYVPFSMPVGEIIALAHRHDVPAYPCISHSGMIRREPYGPGTPYAVEGWLGAAANCFAAGAEGISLFNLFPRPGDDPINRLARDVFSHAGDPKTLAGRDKLFCLDNEAHMATHGYINHVVPYDHCLPKAVEAGKALTVRLPVGEEVSDARTRTLRVQTNKAAELKVACNGESVALAPDAELARSIGMHWRSGSARAVRFRKGLNEVTVRAPKEMEPAARLTGLELLVKRS